ncbi:hypothetical protein C8J57DRAFT_1638805, partial [Mycena rebaudengoi]
FQLAACRGNKEIIDFFYLKGLAETEPIGTYGTALQAASANGHIEVVRLLLDNRNDKEKYLNGLGGHYGTALCAACANEEFEVAKLLVEEGAKAERTGELADTGEMAANVEVGERFGSPLHVATLVGNIKIITLLL